MFVYVYHIVLLLSGISKEDIIGFLTPASLLGWFLSYIVIGCFTNFLVNPYYEPLLSFMTTTVFHDKDSQKNLHIKVDIMYKACNHMGFDLLLLLYCMYVCTYVVCMHVLNKCKVSVNGSRWNIIVLFFLSHIKAYNSARYCDYQKTC